MFGGSVLETEMLSGGSWRKAGWADGFKGELGSPEFCIQHGKVGPWDGGCGPGAEGAWLPGEKSWLDMASAGHLRNGSEQQTTEKAKVIFPHTLLAFFQADLRTSRWSQGRWPLPPSSDPSATARTRRQSEARWGRLSQPLRSPPVCLAHNKIWVSGDI